MSEDIYDVAKRVWCSTCDAPHEECEMRFDYLDLDDEDEPEQPVSGTPATSIEIVYRYMAMSLDDLTYNWGTWHHGAATNPWNVNDETYINGRMLTIDGDYWEGYLLECVDRTSGVVSYIALNLYHGPKPDGTYEHDFVTYPLNCGTFFERTDAADHVVVSHWAVSNIYGMADSYFDKERES